MSDATPAGFAPVFHGWNVWDLYQADSPDRSIFEAIWNAGISPARSLRLWVENQIEDNAPGANLSDPLNPSPDHLRGDEVQEIAQASGLARAAVRESLPELAGALQLGEPNSTASLHTVRFYNRGAASVMPWPRDKNFLVDVVYQPSATNPITNSAPPITAGGIATDVANAAATSLGHAVEVAAVILGGGLLLLALTKIGKAR